jgi:hypothetical protein
MVPNSITQPNPSLLQPNPTYQNRKTYDPTHVPTRPTGTVCEHQPNPTYQNPKISDPIQSMPAIPHIVAIYVTFSREFCKLCLNAWKVIQSAISKNKKHGLALVLIVLFLYCSPTTLIL